MRCTISEGSLSDENQLDLFSHFATTPLVTDGHTDTGPQHINGAICLCVAYASRGKNWPIVASHELRNNDARNNVNSVETFLMY